MYLKEKNSQRIEEITELADRHTEIRREAFPLGGSVTNKYLYTENMNNILQILQRQTKLTCYHCNSVGHYSTNCPKKDVRKLVKNSNSIILNVLNVINADIMPQITIARIKITTITTKKG